MYMSWVLASLGITAGEWTGPVLEPPGYLDTAELGATPTVPPRSGRSGQALAKPTAYSLQGGLEGLLSPQGI